MRQGYAPAVRGGTQSWKAFPFLTSAPCGRAWNARESTGCSSLFTEGDNVRAVQSTPKILCEAGKEMLTAKVVNNFTCWLHLKFFSWALNEGVQGFEGFMMRSRLIYDCRHSPSKAAGQGDSHPDLLCLSVT